MRNDPLLTAPPKKTLLVRVRSFTWSISDFSPFFFVIAAILTHRNLVEKDKHFQGNMNSWRKLTILQPSTDRTATVDLGGQKPTGRSLRPFCKIFIKVNRAADHHHHHA